MPLTDAEARHFLGRIGFVPSDDDVAFIVGREIADVVNDVLTLPANLPARPSYFDTLEDWQANAQTLDWWYNRMRLSRWAGRGPNVAHPLIEKLTLFWHGHFASAFQKVQDAELMWEQNQILRDNALGDFETMCQQVSLHGAMLIYLDNETNVAGGVQENFGRELMELFTMGIGNYTEFDVVEMARAWTGHGTVGWDPVLEEYNGTYEFHPGLHDNGDKTIFGIEQNWDGPGTITEIVHGARQAATASFLATKLWRYFVNGQPSANAIQTVAGAFVSSGMNITEAMRALLTHPEFWTSTRALVKSPAQFVVDFARRTGRPFNDGNMGWYTQQMGQVLFEPPNVAGWGTNGYWLSTATAWGRSNYVNGQRWSLNQAGFLSELAGMNAGQGTAHLLQTFGIHNESATTRDAITTWYQVTRANNDWALAPVGISLAALCPEFQVI